MAISERPNGWPWLDIELEVAARADSASDLAALAVYSLRLYAKWSGQFSTTSPPLPPPSGSGIPYTPPRGSGSEGDALSASWSAALSVASCSGEEEYGCGGEAAAPLRQE